MLDWQGFAKHSQGESMGSDATAECGGGIDPAQHSHNHMSATDETLLLPLSCLLLTRT